MAGDPTQIVVAGTGTISIAPFGTTLPAITTTHATLDAAFVDLGFTTDDGVTISDAMAVDDINAWQSLYPVRRVITGYSGSVSFDLLQWSKDIFEQVLHGVVTEPTADVVHQFLPTRDGVLPEKSLIIDFIDGAELYRWIFEKVTLGADISIPIDKKTAGVIPTEWGVQDAPSGPFDFRTTDVNFSID